MEFKGFTYGYNARRGDLLKDSAFYSRERLIDTGINYVCFAFGIFQETYASTKIMFDYKRSPTDGEITEAIKHFKSKGVKVCLKPILNCMDGVWRAYINFPDADMMGNDVYWNAWFNSYTDYMLHYAGIARDTGCEMFCAGCEMAGTERKEDYWREVLAKIREVYNGIVIYNTNHGDEEKVKWWDAVDFIGTSAYYPVAEKGGAALADMVAKWEQVGAKLAGIADKYNKKIIFAEIGCRSAEGCAVMPWDFTHREFPWSEEEQARFYDSCLSVFTKKDWFAGAFWWDWGTSVYKTREEAQTDTGFNIHLKKAEDVIKKWYKGS